jgi:hypothetical protein
MESVVSDGCEVFELADAVMVENFGALKGLIYTRGKRSASSAHRRLPW